MTDLNTGVLETKEYSLAETQIVYVSLKTSNAGLSVDARKWNKFQNMDEFVPTKKGLQLTIKQWKAVMPLIQGFIEANDVEKAA